MIQPWPRIGSTPLGEFRIFSLRADRILSPRDGSEHEMIVIDCVHWVNVIAVTPDHQMVMVEQYRHGSGTVELEIPGGMMDAEDASPVASGVRELREETGYEGEQARLIGNVFSNPAIMTNTCYTVLVQNCAPRHAVEFDPGEELVTRLVPVAKLPELVRAGTIRHSLVVAALHHFHLLRQAEPSSR